MIKNLVWATSYSAFAIPLAAGALYSQGVILSPALGATEPTVEAAGKEAELEIADVRIALIVSPPPAGVNSCTDSALS